MSKLVISFNQEQCGIHIVVPAGRRLDENEKAILKSLGFAWHRKLHYYYTKYTKEKYEQLKVCCLGKDAQLPAKTKESVMNEMAAAEAANKPKKEPKPKSTQAQKIDDLTAQVAALTKIMQSLVPTEK